MAYLPQREGKWEDLNKNTFKVKYYKNVNKKIRERESNISNVIKSKQSGVEGVVQTERITFCIQI